MSTRRCPLWRNIFDRVLLLLLVLGSIVASTAFVVGWVNLNWINFLRGTIPGLPAGILANAPLVALTEELTMRAIPVSLAIVFYILIMGIAFRGKLCYKFGEDSLIIGTLGGFTAGIVELYAKVHFSYASQQFLAPFMVEFWKHPNFNPIMLAPVFMHTIAGTILIGAIVMVASGLSVERSDVFLIAGGYAVTTAIHWIWNSWWLDQEWFWDWWVATYTGPGLFFVGILALFGLVFLVDLGPGEGGRTEYA